MLTKKLPGIILFMVMRISMQANMNKIEKYGNTIVDADKQARAEAEKDLITKLSFIAWQVIV